MTELLSRLLTIPVVTGGGVGVVEVDPRPDRKVEVSRHNIFFHLHATCEAEIHFHYSMMETLHLFNSGNSN